MEVRQLKQLVVTTQQEAHRLSGAPDPETLLRASLNASRANVLRYIAGTGSAVTDLIFSIAKRDVTFFSGTALISFL